MNDTEKKPILSEKQIERIGHYFFGVTIVIELILLFFLFLACRYYNNHPKEIFTILALGLVLLWIGVLVAYYAWSIYFYNINFGITDKDWVDIEANRNTENELTEPTKNPNSEETFGLPPGTVRGSIALTLLVGTLAMTLMSFGKTNIVKENEIFVDNFDFFKTAFLMMVAFYFGQKTLEYLLPGNKTKNSNENKPAEQTNLTQDGAQG